jgi:hypothetical protein
MKDNKINLVDMYGNTILTIHDKKYLEIYSLLKDVFDSGYESKNKNLQLGVYTEKDYKRNQKFINEVIEEQEND